ncbi:cobalamin biosynthesis protein CbiD [Thermodesulfatator indicus DSM 15286]|uniref:Cobalt-precorrin-5B C(1)-methyltransferase n=1 Tax=Thermodesulfatator indicus (strain DSM 15286 / JCM 11887 / CIR29812) TaxID=667014 RepID=F8ACC2_THEID|nr:cobalt-precorrin-5B (C(1))-methyltransferase [Thermodesulfatator indicus]AEH45760.1 cobalamin biosynthesis protein CbiD [Thermodesulfatator indicus DSM 15286]
MKLPKHVKGRLGFTTGTCATGALKAALIYIVKGKKPRTVKLTLPIGQNVKIPIAYISKNGFSAKASVIKDAGDDPDVTHGAEIQVKVELKQGTGKIIFKAGEGVGIVTKPGLGLPVGEPAITSVPRCMMENVISEVLGPQRTRKDVIITISVPEGDKLAQKTLNPRLGIEGGLSILGTKGVVIPFSTAAYKATIAKALRVAKTLKLKEVVFATGGRSEAFCQKLFSELPEEAFVQVGDFIGFSLKLAAAYGFERVTLGLMVGKMAKVAKGLSNTHAKHNKIPLEMMLKLAKEINVAEETINILAEGQTARFFLETLKEKSPEALPLWAEKLTLKAVKEARQMANRKVFIRGILFDFSGKPLAWVEH